MKDTVNLVGTPTFTLTSADGTIKQQFTIPNMVVTAGKNLVAEIVLGQSTSLPSHMAVGTDLTPANSAQTNLGAIAGTRVAISGVTVNANTILYSAVFAAGEGTGALTEAGIFNAITAGDMLSRTVFPVFNKEAVDTLTINWDITIN